MPGFGGVRQFGQLVLFLLVLVLFGSYAGAEPFCGEVNFSVYPISITSGTFIDRTFTLQNNSTEGFYIDDFNAYDSDADFNVIKLSNDTYASANSTANLYINISASSGITSKTSSAYAKVNGHFASGKVCDYNALGEKTFGITITGGIVSTDAECTKVKVNAGSISMSGNSTAIEAFSLQNNSSQNFYIDSFDVYEDSADISAIEQGYDATANANGTANLNLKVDAYSASENKSATAYAKVAGHFTSGLQCGPEAIGVASFTVYVSGATSTNCNEFLLSVPAEKRMVNSAEITITAANPLQSAATIVISGGNIGVSQGTVSVSAGETISKTLTLSNLAAEEAWLVYDVLLSGCNIPAKLTHIVKGADSIGMTHYNSAVEIENEVDVKVELKNNSPNAKQFALAITNLPAEWEAQNLQGSLDGDETRAVLLKVRQKGAVFGNSYKAKLVLSYDSTQIERDLTFNARLSGQIENASIQTSVVQSADEKSYEVSVIVDNNSAGGISGGIEIEVPENWEVKGKKEIAVPAGQSAETKLVVIPSGAQNTGEIGSVSFVAGDGRRLEEFVSFTPKGIAASVAFAAFASNAVFFGFIAIVAVAIIFVHRGRMAKARTEPVEWPYNWGKEAGEKPF